MATAVLVLDNLHGYEPGLARLYRIDPPLLYDGREHDHVLVWIRPGGGAIDPAVSVIMATRRGAPAEGSMRERPGSFLPHGNPLDSPETIEKACEWALATAGQWAPDNSEKVGDPYVITPAAA